MGDEDRRYGLEDGFRDGSADRRSQVDRAGINLGDYEIGYLAGYSRAQRGGVPLFTVSVALHDNDYAIDSDTEDPDDEEIRAMAYAAVEAVWAEIWAQRERTPRGQDVRVSAALADGTVVHSASK